MLVLSPLIGLRAVVSPLLGERIQIVQEVQSNLGIEKKVGGHDSDANKPRRRG